MMLDDVHPTGQLQKESDKKRLLQTVTAGSIKKLSYHCGGITTVMEDGTSTGVSTVVAAGVALVTTADSGVSVT